MDLALQWTGLIVLPLAMIMELTGGLGRRVGQRYGAHAGLWRYRIFARPDVGRDGEWQVVRAAADDIAGEYSPCLDRSPRWVFASVVWRLGFFLTLTPLLATASAQTFDGGLESDVRVDEADVSTSAHLDRADRAVRDMQWDEAIDGRVTGA